MAINVVCSGCSKTLKAPDEAAGKQARCPHCRTVMQVPAPATSAPPVEEDAGYALSAEAPLSRSTFVRLEPPATRRGSTAESLGERPAKKKAKRPADAVTAQGDPFAAPADRATRADERSPGQRPKRSTKHWWFALTLVPLVFALLGGDDSQRTQKMRADHPGLLEQYHAGNLSKAEMFEQLPDGKFEDAHLSSQTWMHWVYALVACGLFSFLILTLFERGDANVAHVLVVGATTATVGIFMLLAFQFVADLTQNLWLRGGGIVMLVFYLVKLIGFSYRAALDPANGFLASFFGFTLGVGLCEHLPQENPLRLSPRLRSSQSGVCAGRRPACAKRPRRYRTGCGTPLGLWQRQPLEFARGCVQVPAWPSLPNRRPSPACSILRRPGRSIRPSVRRAVAATRPALA